MDKRITVLFVLCTAMLITAGCTGGGQPAGTATPATTAPETAGTTAPVDALSCTTDADCVPAQCCHPTSCTNQPVKQPCTIMCTESCEGPIDCGAGSCGCVAGTCAVVPARAVSVTLSASPQRYSPMMSSTPGIALAPEVTGFVPAETTVAQNGSDFVWNTVNFEWNATFGEFLMWESPDYQVHRIGNPAATGEQTVYWTCTEKPESTKEPVVITVTARDMTRQGAVLGTSSVTLAWDGDSAVYVGKIT